MPVIIAEAAPALIALLRQLIIALVTTALWEVVASALQGIIEKLKSFIQNSAGLSDDDARTYIANFIIETLETTGILVLVLKTRLPVKTADYLGFTTKGFVKRAPSTAATAKVGTKIATTESLAVNAPKALAQAELEIAASKGVSFAQVKSITAFIATLIGLPVGVFYAFAQYMDYAAWQNPYQHTMENLLSKIGINPDTAMPKARTISSDTWQRIYSTVETLQPISITLPTTGQNLPYSRQNLADAADSVAANIAAGHGDATYKNVLAILLPLIRIKGAAAVTPTQGAQTPAVHQATSTATPRIFTGVVSQGVLSSATVFAPRPDDLITSIGELETAAANNLAPFLAGLPTRITYEVKVVLSVVTANGFTQRGTTQRVQSGTYATGAPKYKTVTNKFAVLNLYIQGKSGTRSALAQIVLGPTDAINFQPTSDDISAVETFLQSGLHISDAGVINSVNPTAAAAPTQQAPTPAAPQNTAAYTPPPRLQITPRDYYVEADGFNGAIFYRSGDTIFRTEPDRELIAQSERASIGNYGQQISVAASRLRELGFDVETARRDPFPFEIGGRIPPYETQKIADFFGPSAGNTEKAAAQKSGQNAACAAATLYDFYTARGEQLPPLATRADLYASFNLGSASFYTGTAEQNSKLLFALRAQMGCAI